MDLLLEKTDTSILIPVPVMPLKGEIHEPATSFCSKAGDDDKYGSAIFNIPKIIIILIYFANF
jgi:hypothetical protein